MDLNLIAWVIGAVLLVLGLTKSGKNKKAGDTFKYLGVALLVVGLVLPMIGYDLLGGIDLGGAVPGAIPAAGGGLTTVCAVEDTTVTLSAINAYTAAASGATHSYKINGAPALTETDAAGAIIASPGDSIEILWAGESSDTYYADVTKEIIPCVGTKTFSTELYQNGTLTFRVFNEEGNLIDGAGENETIGVQEVVNLEFDIQGTYQMGFPYGGVIVAEYNNTDFDKVEVQAGGSSTNVPGIHTLSSTDNIAKAFTVAPILSNQKITGTILLDSSGENPGDANDPVLTFYPNDYFINEDTSGSFDGPAVEDEDDAATFGHSTSFTVSVD